MCIRDSHYVKEGDMLVPAGQTEFARDKTFGYHSSHLGEYVEEKSGGRYRKEDSIYITLSMPVSYTHLDVYKRQIKYSGRSSGRYH